MPKSKSVLAFKMNDHPPRGRFSGAILCRTVLLCGLVLLWTGCHTTKITEPKRSITEQLLLSSAADRAIEKVDLAELRGKKVYVEERYFKSRSLNTETIGQRI